MIRVIARLIESGHAYVVGGAGSRVVYFRVKSFGPYGRLSGNTLDQLREGEGGRIAAANQAQKEHPADFLLWKEDARHIMKWDSPWGAGYPGWHIECTVMAVRGLLGADVADFARPDGESIIDLHSGGEDNIFPHHECEIAQSCCAFNADPGAGSFARMWFHPRFLIVEGEKMSKSRGNFFTPRDLFAKGVEPAALRMELIRTHYRSNANFTEQGLKDSQRMVERWRRIADAAGGIGGAVGLAAPASAHGRRALDEFTRAMDDDLNVAGAIAAVNTFASACDTPTPEDAAVLRVIDAALGVLSLERPRATTSDIGVFAAGVTPDPAVVRLLEERRDARAAKDFKRSDAIRDELAAMGYAIKDAPGGKVEVRRA